MQIKLKIYGLSLIPLTLFFIFAATMFLLSTEAQKNKYLDIMGLFAKQLDSSISAQFYERYGDIQAFADLEPVHAEVHRLGPEIVRLRAAGELEQARAGVRALLELKDRILDGLAALQKSVATRAGSAPPLIGRP